MVVKHQFIFCPEAKFKRDVQDVTFSATSATASLLVATRDCSYTGQYDMRGTSQIQAPSFDSQTPDKSEEAEALKAQQEADPERTASGRVQRASAQVANFQLAEIASNDLPKDWPKRKFQSDLVPDDKKARRGGEGSRRGVCELVLCCLSCGLHSFDGVPSS